MSVRPYSPEQYCLIEYWHTLRGIGCPPKAALPRVGVIANNLAAGFLYQTDSCFAIIDGYIANPVSDKAERDAALDAVTLALLEKAKELGFTHVKCETKLPSIGARATRLGFTCAGTFTYFVREL